MFHVILSEPEIPQNTGNIIRLCANTGATLHLIRPLGFRLDDRQLKRAGLDYHEWAHLNLHDSLNDFMDNVGPNTVYAFSTHGQREYHTVNYQPGNALLFGPETRGLGAELRERFNRDNLLRIPMRPESRSINLSNSVAIVLYEAWRQCRFAIEIQGS